MLRSLLQNLTESLSSTAAEFRERMIDLLSTEPLLHNAQLNQSIIGPREAIQCEINTWRQETATT